MDDKSANTGPLADVRILDLAGPKASFCGKVLADLGAQVIKAELPHGDPARRLGPFGQDKPTPQNSLYYLYHNAGKQHTTLNLERASGREALKREIGRCDVLLETFRPGYLDALSLGFKALSGINPSLIMVSVTGFGQSGPRKDYKSCDLVASAMGGQMYVTGSPQKSPLRMYGNQSYYTAGLYAALGVLLALARKKKTGQGSHLDISLQEAVASSLDHVMVRYFHETEAPQRRGDRHWNDFFCILPCRDGFIQLNPLLGWNTLVELLDGEGVAGDLMEEAWADEDYRRQKVDHIIEVFAGWTAAHGVDELFHLGQLLRLPWAPVQSARQILECPQLAARNYFHYCKHPGTGQRLPFAGPPYGAAFGHSLTGMKLPMKAPPASRGASGETGIGHSGENILSGVRVVDFTRVLAGPFATRILADFGAEVIKIQSGKIVSGAEENTRPYFSAWNRNKRSLTLNMNFPEAREILLRLISISDVVAENFSARVMANWGLEYEELRKVRQNLVMLSMSGMGHSGPWKNYAAYGPTVQSLGGLTALTSYDQTAPVGLGHAHADVISGIYGAIAVLAALRKRDHGGGGAHIDLSEYEAVCSLIGPALMAAAGGGKPVVPMGNRAAHISAGPHGCYPCLGHERWCVIAAFDQHEWRALCKVCGHPEWVDDARFATPEMRIKNADQLDALITHWTREMEAEEVMAFLQSAGVPAGVVQSAADLANDPHLLARGFWGRLKHPHLGEEATDNTPVRIAGHSMGQPKLAPMLGEGNQYVCRELLGMSKARFEALIKKGVIA